MSDSPLLKHVHPSLVYRRLALADVDNGLSLLRAANEAIVNEGDEIGHLYYADEDCECGDADCLACNHDYATIMRMLVRVLEKNSRCLKLYGQLLEKGRVRFPTPRSGPWLGGAPSDYSHDLERIKALEIRWARERGDLVAAARGVRERAQMASIIGRGEGALSNYILAMGILRAALWNALVLVDDSAISLEGLDELARIGPLVLDGDDLAQTTRAGFRITLDSIESVERLRALPERIDHVLQHFYPQRPLLEEGDNWDDEGRIAERRRQMHVVLDGHPHAWDAAETVRRLSSQVARTMQLDWQQAEPDAEPEDRNALEFWQHLPPQLQPHFSIEWLGTSASAVEARDQARDFGAEIEEEASSDEELATAREALRGVDNPIGLLVENALQPTDIRDICRECQELGWSLEERIRERRESPSA